MTVVNIILQPIIFPYNAFRDWWWLITTALISFILPAWRVALSDSQPMSSVSGMLCISSLSLFQAGLPSVFWPENFSRVGTREWNYSVLSHMHLRLYQMWQNRSLRWSHQFTFSQVPISPHPSQQNVVRFNNVFFCLSNRWVQMIF